MLIISGVPEPSMSTTKSAVDESANRTLSPAKAGDPPYPIFEQYYSILVIIIMILTHTVFSTITITSCPLDPSFLIKEQDVRRHIGCNKYCLKSIGLLVRREWILFKPFNITVICMYIILPYHCYVESSRFETML